MPDEPQPQSEADKVRAQTSDGADVIEGLDPDISQDADPHPGA